MKSNGLKLESPYNCRKLKNWLNNPLAQVVLKFLVSINDRIEGMKNYR